MRADSRPEVVSASSDRPPLVASRAPEAVRSGGAPTAQQAQVSPDASTVGPQRPGGIQNQATGGANQYLLHNYVANNYTGTS